MSFIGFYDYTVVLTYMSLVSALLGMVSSYRGEFALAVSCLAFSGICDMFDGIVARTKKDRTVDEKNFGIQLDSLCDIVSFGVAPAVLLYFWGVRNTAGVAVLVFYVLCALIRLAFFNVLETKRQMTEGGIAKGYRGLPVTAAAILFPLVFLIDAALPRGIIMTVYYLLPLLVGFLFILDFHVPKIDFVKLVQQGKPRSAVR